jgi:hypothetical protein
MAMSSRNSRLAPKWRVAALAMSTLSIGGPIAWSTLHSGSSNGPSVVSVGNLLAPLSSSDGSSTGAGGGSSPGGGAASATPGKATTLPTFTPSGDPALDQMGDEINSLDQEMTDLDNVVAAVNKGGQP